MECEVVETGRVEMKIERKGMEPDPMRPVLNGTLFCAGYTSSIETFLTSSNVFSQTEGETGSSGEYRW